ncbi:MAG: hypothetical protein C0501_11500 [Isosphaera sp.]|nr:hypothetical protein [Isosphaera sp.]
MAVLAPPAEPAVRPDQELIQGAWVSVAGPRGARLLVAGSRFTIELDGDGIYTGTFDLAPGGMDIRIEAGPARHVGSVVRCLYQLEGGVLRWCPGRPGSGERPAAFPDVDDARHLSLVFRRPRQ